MLFETNQPSLVLLPKKTPTSKFGQKFRILRILVQEDVPDHDDPHRGGLGNLLRRRAGSGDTVHMHFGVGKNGEVRLPVEIRRLELQKQNCLTYSCLTDSKLHVNGVYR